MAMRERGMLAYFATTYLDHPDYWLARALKMAAQRFRPSFVRQLERRSFHELPFTSVRTRAGLEILRTLAGSVLKRPLLADAIWEREEHDFDAWVAGSLPTQLDAVYTFEHAALRTLQAARRRGVFTFYEQPSQHHRFFSRIYADQVKRYPEIRSSATELQDPHRAAPRDNRRDAELALADCVLCNSTFTRNTLLDAGVDEQRILVTPYGFPTIDVMDTRRERRPVVFLNAGTQNLRKGLHLLYRAWRKLAFAPSEAELWLVGRMTLPEETRRDLSGAVRILDSVPHAELLMLYKQASVFVLPSLADGFGMVISEAMSRGLAVIATDRTGAPDIMEHGVNGFIIPAGDEDALVNQMKWCVEHSDALHGIGARAAERAASWQWSNYRSALAEKVASRIEAQRAVSARVVAGQR
jgi:glycosyltransferase involved in cell wall biosynthesis